MNQSAREAMVAIALAITLSACDPRYVAPNAVVVSPPVTGVATPVAAMPPMLVGAAAGPVAVMTHRGEVLTGEAVTTATGGSFAVTNARLQCTGTYDPAPGQQSLMSEQGVRTGARV